MDDSFFKKVWRFLTNRILWVFIFCCFMFYILVARLFSLQIVNGRAHEEAQITTTTIPVSISSSRGLIYDRYGVPLAVNEVAYCLKIDNNINMNSDEKNQMFLDLIELLDRNGETIIDDFPISETRPYEFKIEGTAERNWKINMGIEEQDYDISAEEMMERLKSGKWFSIPEELDEITARRLVALRSASFLKRFNKLMPTMISTEVKNETLIELEEKNEKFPGVFVDTMTLRRYPAGVNFSHMLGYIRSISAEELEIYKGYKMDAIVGKDGIEKAMELELQGKEGMMLVETDSTGRRVGVTKETQPMQGNQVYLTIDSNLQNFAAKSLEKMLAEVIIGKLEERYEKDGVITIKQFFTSMIMSNNISIEKIIKSNADSQQDWLKEVILDEYENYIIAEAKAADERRRNGITDDGQEEKVIERTFNISNAEHTEVAKQALVAALERGTISPRQMVLVLYEQGIINLDDYQLTQVQLGGMSPLSIIVEKLRSLEITPQMTNLDPSTGSLTVTHIKTGEILAMVTYPTYDNNQFVNNFNYPYYRSLLYDDPTKPIINRPLQQLKAPGSTFKMLSAVAGLDSGVVTLKETIQDLGEFTKSGHPPAKCWIYSSGKSTHGHVNTTKAIEVSCNYYFYELAYRLGLMNPEESQTGIRSLNKYMEYFGLTDYTGVEIAESFPIVSSPETKERLFLQVNPEATTSQTKWVDGDTIRTAIGQAFNAFSTTSMAKYIATLANGGKRYQSHLVDKITTFDGILLEEVEPNEEFAFEIDQRYLDEIFKGMLAVTTEGSVKEVFEDFPVVVAGKTGTAQEASYRKSHTWFVGFAPYDNPEIAIAVCIPFGESSQYPAAVVAKEVIGEYMGVGNPQEKRVSGNVLAK